MSKQLDLYDIAKKEEGVHEWEPGVNPRIVEYHSHTSLAAKDDSVPWCSSFMNWCCAKAGIKGTNSAAARSWLKWGEEVTEPQVGDLVILQRGASKAFGHVGFYEGVNSRVNLPLIKVFAGNVGDRVGPAWEQSSHVLGYRRIKG